MSYPYPPNDQGPNVGFSEGAPSMPGSAYPPFPNSGGNYPSAPTNSYAPPLNANPYTENPGGLPYSLNPGANTNAPFGATPYPPTSSPYPSSQPDVGHSAPYPPGAGATPYPPGAGATPYPPGAEATPYPPGAGATTPYPPGAGATTPYPPGAGATTPYPPGAGATQYPPEAGSTAYPPGLGSSPYPPGANSYPPAPGPSYPPGQPGASPYPPGQPGNSPYPPVPGAFSSAPAVNSAYPPLSQPGSSPYPPAAQSYAGPGQQGYPPNPSPYSKSSTSTYSNLSAGNHPTGQASGGSMWPYHERPTITPVSGFDPSNDAAVLRKAMKGFGTDENAIIQVLGRRTSYERQQIKLKYQQAYGQDLERDLKSELGGKSEEVILALMTPMDVYLANEIYKAIKGFGTNETTLIEILCTSSNRALCEIKAAYKLKYKNDIEKDLIGDTSGDFRRLLVSVAAASRDEQHGDTSVAPSLAQELCKAGTKKKFGTDEEDFNRILCVYSYPVLRCTFEEYRKITGKTFEQAITSETSGSFRDGLLAIYRTINNRAAYFAQELQDAMKGLGTKDSMLIRVVVARCEIDMGNIKDEYYKMFGKQLEKAISSETSGDYKKILLALIQG